MIELVSFNGSVRYLQFQGSRMKNIGNITLAAWVVTFLLGYFGLGAWLYEVMEGMDRSMVPSAPL